MPYRYTRMMTYYVSDMPLKLLFVWIAVTLGHMSIFLACPMKLPITELALLYEFGTM